MEENSYHLELLENVAIPHDDGVEYSEAGSKEYGGMTEHIILAGMIESLNDIGVNYHEASDVIFSGGMKNTISFLYNFFDVENFVKFLSSVPVEVLDKFSAILYSDHVDTEEVLFEIFSLFSVELPFVDDFSLITYYRDLYFSDDKFVIFCKSILIHIRNSVISFQIQGLATEEEKNSFSNSVIKHKQDVKIIVDQIIEKSEINFDIELISNLIDSLDNDLLFSDNLNYFAIDKSLFKSSYHTFSRHPAIEKFHNHKISSFHHIEYYLMNNIDLESDYERFINFIVVMIGDIFETGMTINIFKQTVISMFKKLNLSDEFYEKLENILSLISVVPVN